MVVRIYAIFSIAFLFQWVVGQVLHLLLSMSHHGMIWMTYGWAVMVAIYRSYLLFERTLTGVGQGAALGGTSQEAVISYLMFTIVLEVCGVKYDGLAPCPHASLAC